MLPGKRLAAALVHAHIRGLHTSSVLGQALLQKSHTDMIQTLR